MPEYVKGQKIKLNKPAHIFNGVIIMPGVLVEVIKKNSDGTYDLLYHDREMNPHTMKNISAGELSE